VTIPAQPPSGHSYPYRGPSPYPDSLSAPPPCPRPAFLPPPAKPSPLPAEPVGYPHLLRGKNFRWWRPLAAIGLFVAGYALVTLLLLVVMLILEASGQDSRAVLENIGTPMGFGLTIASLVVLVPISLVAVRVAYRTPMGYVASVAGRFRWRWALRCALLVLPIWLVLMLVNYLSGDLTGGPHRYWPILMIMVVLLIPLQAAGEEFAFRGFLQQVLGSWFRNRWLALVIPAIVSIPLFALAHGSFDRWIFADLAVSATAWVYLAWRTGGLEAGVAVHTINNCTLMLTSLALGGFEKGFVSAETQGSWFSLSISMGTTGLAVLVITWQARRLNIQRWFDPRAAGSLPATTAVGSAGVYGGIVGEGPAQGAHGGAGLWPGDQQLGDGLVRQPQSGHRPRG